jgi:hypothetical protein
MHDNLKGWFKNDYWSHEEAACLMHGIPPKTHHGLSLTVNDVHKIGNIEVFIPKTKVNKANEILKLLSIFEAASWESDNKDGKRIWCEYFKMAERKGINVDFALKCSRNSFEKQNKNKSKPMEQEKTSDKNDSIDTFSPEMKEVLDPIAKLILSFEDSTDYIKHNKKIQQGLIDNWLEDKTNTGHEKRFLKELISKYYRITSVRK